MKPHRFKQVALALLAIVAFAMPSYSQAVTGFNDLNYWGTGTNHSAIVISWNDGKTDSTLAWGFSWDETTTVGDMLTALASADPRLFVRIDSASSLGTAIFGIGYDANGNGIFSVTGAHDVDGNPTTPIFTAGISDMNTDPGHIEAPYFDSNPDPDAQVASANTAPGEAADHYAEGWWDNGYWEFFTGDASTTYPASWTSDITGASTVLVNNGWYAFSIAGEYDPDLGTSPSFPPGAAIAAVPEPATVALLALGGIVLLWRLRSRHA